jgi:hypothetical protein
MTYFQIKTQILITPEERELLNDPATWKAANKVINMILDDAYSRKPTLHRVAPVIEYFQTTQLLPRYNARKRRRVMDKLIPE